MGADVLIAHKKSDDYGLVEKLNKFKDLNLSVSTVDETSQLAQTLQNNTPKVLILDSDFVPDHKVEFLKEVKAMIGQSELPIIVLSSFGNENYLDEAGKVGMVDFINYKISDLELKLRIKSVLYRQSLSKKIKEQKDQINDFTFIANRTGNSIIVINRNGDIEWVNEAFTNLYGYTLESFTKKYGSNIIQTEIYNQTTKENFLKCVRKGETVNYSNSWEIDEKQIKWIRTTLSPVFDDSNIVSKVIAIESDFTEVKNTEQSLEEKNKHLLALTENLEYTNKLLEQKMMKLNLKNQSLTTCFLIFSPEKLQTN